MDDRYLEDGSKRYIDQQLAQILERNFTEHRVLLGFLEAKKDLLKNGII